MIELLTFGAIDLRHREGTRRFAALLAQPKRVAVLVFLSAARPHGWHRRDRLLAMFWPESDEARARNALNQTVYVVRRALGEGSIVTRGDGEIGIEPSAVMCDAVTFRDALAAGQSQAALDAYRGDFLAGFHLSDCPEFERWVETERAAFTRDALAAAKRLAAADMRAGNPSGAAQWLLRGGTFAPYDEALLRDVLKALDAVGDRAGAIRAYGAFAAALARDLELEPSSETRRLIDEIRQRMSSNGTDGVPPAAVVTSPSVATDDDDGAEVRRVARQIVKAERFDKRRRRLVIAAAALTVLVAGTFAATRAAGNRRIASPDLNVRRVLVLPFENQSGDTALAHLGGMVADWITHTLAQTNMVDVVPPPMALGAQRLVSAAETGAIGGASALAREVGARLVVSGSFHRNGAGLAFQARLQSASTGSVLRALDVSADSAQSIEQSVEQVRQRVAGALATIIDPRMEAWAQMASQPPSFEAYQLYARAFERMSGPYPGPQLQAAHLFLQAAALDSSFTMPLIWAMRMFNDAGAAARTDTVVRRLAAIRDRLAPWDRAMYDYQAAALHGRHVDAYRAMKRVVDLVPGSQWVVQLGWAAIWAGRPREAIAILTNIEPRWIGDERSLLPTAGGPRYWNALTTARHLAGDFSGELSDVARMRRGNPDAGRVTELMALAALGRVEDVERRTLELLNTTPAGAEGNVRDVARELRAHGHEAAAQRLFERIIEWRQRAPVVKQTQGYRQDLASLMFDAGRWSETRALNEALLAEEPENWVAAGHLGILAAMSGDRPEAERKLTWLLEREREFDTGEPTVWAAAVASHLGELERAIAIYERGLEKGFYQYHRSIHVRRALAPLFAYPPFVEMMRPKG